ncbi:uncharacterized protein [Coffea arabica]|uniref:Uncharacterized protein n=1 Tax=Coffea arabica TaxID=13443 RepID=A0A6P6S5E2_COFAR|nr:uncharacterized protein LOC113687654 [Coffea arabica]
MATSILTASSDHNTNPTLSGDHNNLLHHYDHHFQTATPPTTRRDHHQTSRQSSAGPGRRKSSSSRKKQPQRGMGVAQLERLRLGDRWKIITEINPQAQSPHSSVPYGVIPTSPGQDPTSFNTVPMHLAELGVYPLNLNQAAMLVQRVGNTSATMGLFHGQGLVFSGDKFPGNPHGVGVENGSETSTKELSSTPSLIKCYPDHCTVCHLKKRHVRGENLVTLKGSLKDVNAAEMPSITSSDFVGLNVGNSPYNNRGTKQNFGKTATFHAGTYSAGGTIEQGTLEVVAVQRKASSSRGGSGRLFYEFFPSGIGVSKSESHDSDQNEELTRTMMKKEADGSESCSSDGVAVMGCAGDAYCATKTTTTGGAVDGSNSIDLSLRLSY